MIKIHTEPPAIWEELGRSFNVKWEGNLVVTYDGKIHCPSGRVKSDVLVHELVHIEQQKGQDCRKMVHRYMNDIEYMKSMEIPAFKAQAAFLDATVADKSQLWCRKYMIAKQMVRMYKTAFTFETASGIMNL